MYTLANDQLSLAILDPIADQARLGTRYVAGGYIYQVTDAARGPLLSGPAYPAPEPPVFDGQGLPEAFRDGLGPQGADALFLVPGVGLVTRQAPAAHEVRELREPCVWQVAKGRGQIEFATTQSLGDFGLELVRVVALTGRTITSTTTLRNKGRAEIPFRWFPHPFYPLTADGECCRFSVPVSFPENPGYHWAPSGYIARKLEAWDSARGYFQALTYEARGRVQVAQRHPLLGITLATCNYTPTSIPIWGNRNTFSFEPYFERTLWPAQEATWGMTYDL